MMTKCGREIEHLELLFKHHNEAVEHYAESVRNEKESLYRKRKALIKRYGKKCVSGKLSIGLNSLKVTSLCNSLPLVPPG